jgi:hypothetical protein
MTSGEKGENGAFWEQMEKLGPTKAAWNFPKCLYHLLTPHSCKMSFYLPAWGTLILMTHGEKCENGVFWVQLEKLGPTKGAWNRPKYLNHLPNPQSFKINFYLRAG